MRLALSEGEEGIGTAHLIIGIGTFTLQKVGARLPSQEKISSTEKLLDIIRNEKSSDSHSGVAGLTDPNEERSGLLNGRSFGSSVSVGVDISYRELRLVKVAKDPGGSLKLLDYQMVPFRNKIILDDPEFETFLGEEIRRFCGSSKSLDIWGLMPSADVNVQHIHIPRVGKKKIEDAVYWTAKKNVSFDKDSYVFDFEVQGEVIESGIKKLAVIAYSSPKENVDRLQDLFSRIGFPLAGLTIAPFAFQNIFQRDWIPSFGQTVATLYIGREWSQIDIFSDGIFVMTRAIKTGISSMIEALIDGYSEKERQRSKDRPTKGQSPDSSVSNIKTSMDFDEAKELIYSLGKAEEITDFDLGKEDIFDLINPVLERLVRQVERTFEYYTGTFSKEPVSSIYISSAMDVYQPIIDYIGDQLRIEGDVFDPLSPDNPPVGRLTSDASVSERVAFSPALGLALSDSSHTLNFIHTYKDKEKEETVRKLNVMVIAVLALILCVSFGYFLWLGNVEDEKRAAITRLDDQLTKDIQLNEKTIKKMSAELKKKYRDISNYKERYLGVGMFGELATLTPSNIRLLNVTADREKGSQGSEKSWGLVLEGIVMGSASASESSLAGYVFKLQESPLFSRALISKKGRVTFEGDEGLQFVLNVRIN
jgi:type IV pilus assembly protein PilM